MRCICIRDCTIRTGGKSRYFEKDMIVDFKDCPIHFVPLEDAQIEFEFTSRDILLESTAWEYDDAASWLATRYGHHITGPRLTKREMVDRICDVRDREIELSGE